MPTRPGRLLCSICQMASALAPDQALALINEAVAAGYTFEHFDEVLDQVLGTGTDDDDPELAEAWERSHRGQ
jgi:hypothetical protein